ncbi:MAG: putative dsRNA-binding protein [Gammaproteobacteria bacterium]|nr:putative dsRNA-binding protein [Gammaproteobacteria bacterium]
MRLGSRIQQIVRVVQSSARLNHLRTIDRDTQKKLRAVESRIGYRFNEIHYLQAALTHPSTGQSDYERLEFLGDSVLGLAVADNVYRHYPEEHEGGLTHLKNGQVSNMNLAKIAKDNQLIDHMIYQRRAFPQGFDKQEKIHADVIEAIIGAVFVDGQYEAAYRVILELGLIVPVNEERKRSKSVAKASKGKTAKPKTAKVAKPKRQPKHPKVELQEIVQKQSKETPRYKVVSKPKVPHIGNWTVECRVPLLKDVHTRATGTQIREAEKKCAELMLKELRKNGVLSN